MLAFDSANPSCGDVDLATPGPGPGNTEARGMIAILQEVGSPCSPDDDVNGGTMTFDYDVATRVFGVGVMDTEEGGEVRSTNAAGEVEVVPIPVQADNGWQMISFETTCDIVKVEVEFYGSGAVTDVVSCEDRRVRASLRPAFEVDPPQRGSRGLDLPVLRPRR